MGIEVSAGMEEGGDEEELTWVDYWLHVLSLPWKILFATCPPTDVWGGWACFFVSLAYIAILTACVGEIASLFGCALGLKDEVTAITFVALGTSLPDTFASASAVAASDTADDAIGNVTGSNAVNVFFGLGLPWLIACLYSLPG